MKKKGQKFTLENDKKKLLKLCFLIVFMSTFKLNKKKKNIVELTIL